MISVSKKYCLVMTALVVTTSFNAIALGSISNVDVAQLCKEQSEEILEELGVEPHGWRSERSNSDTKINIEGQWNSRSGIYIVECELPFGADAESLELRVFQGE